MSADEGACPLCQKEFGIDERVYIGLKGAEGINNASVEELIMQVLTSL